MIEPLRITRRQRTFLLTGGIGCIALGFAVVVGWHTQNLALIQVRFGFSPMNYNTALAVASGGVGLFGLALGRGRVVLLSALLPTIFGGLTLVQYGTGVNLGIDQTLHRSAIHFGALYPGRTGFSSALCLSFTGCALGALGWPTAFRGRPILVGALGLLTLGITSSVFFSYLTTTAVGVRLEATSAMAVHGALSLGLLGAGVMIAAWRDYVASSPDVTLSLRASGVAWVVLALSVAATGVVWVVASNAVTDRARARFDEMVQQAHSSIINRMGDYEQILIGGRGLFAGSAAIERDEWGAFVRSVEIEQRYPGIQGVGFASYLPHRDKQRYEAGIRREGFPDFRIEPAGPRADYVVTTFIEPFTDLNVGAFGFDMYADPVRREALERARDTGQPAMSGRVKLDQGSERDAQPGFLLYVPTYKNGMPHATVAERRAALVGFSYGAFQMNDLMNGVLGRTARELRFEIFDGVAAGRDRLLYGDALDEHSLPYRPMFQKTITSEIGGHAWTFAFSTWPSFDDAVYHHEPVIILAGGLVVSLLLFGITWSLTTTRERALALAEKMTAALRRSEAQFRAVADHANDAIVSADGRGTIIMWNRAAGNIFGYTEAEILGKPLPALVSERTWQCHEDALTRVASGGEHGTGETLELTGRRKDGREFPLELSLSAWTQGDRQFYTGILRDITERRQTQNRLDYLATHDALTGLPNRTLFADRLEQALARSAWNKRLVAVMYLDLDRFKAINDTLGHTAGDQLLQTVATRLMAAVREGDTVARRGGDEFTIILIDMAQTDDVALVAQKILNAMAEPVNLNGREMLVTFSIGIACCPVDGTDAQTLLRRADTALYQAKAQGRNNYQLYSSHLSARAS
jgi:diguanylate cyclase (GGDEF)-like protein/PAS domain S-box-containing protein